MTRPDFIHLVTTLNMLILASIQVGIKPDALLQMRQNIRNVCCMQEGTTYPDEHIADEFQHTFVVWERQK